MNRLQLAQRTQLECGVSGTLSTTENQSIAGFARLIAWNDTAWEEIQTRHDDWGWLRSSNILGLGASFTTVAGTASYPLGTGAGTCGVLATAFGKWDRQTFRNYTTSVGVSNENFLDEVPFDVWRDAYMYGAQRSVQTRPVAVAIGPDNSVCLGPPPNALYTVTADYFMAPTAMALDTDTPTGLPTQFQMLIVYKAMMMYGAYEAAPEVYQRGEAGYSSLMARLEALRLPQIAWAGALA
jgi:hypothetical protein